MSSKSEQPVKSILKTDNETGPSLGAYNLYAKRASFKDDVIFQQILLDKPEEPVVSAPVIEQHVPIAPDETEETLSEEERLKREEFKAKRRMLALEGADGMDLKAVLAHRVSLTEGNEDEEDEEVAGGNQTTSELGESGNITESGDHIGILISDYCNSDQPQSTVMNTSESVIHNTSALGNEKVNSRTNT